MFILRATLLLPRFYFLLYLHRKKQNASMVFHCQKEAESRSTRHGAREDHAFNSRLKKMKKEHVNQTAKTKGFVGCFFRGLCQFYNTTLDFTVPCTSFSSFLRCGRFHGFGYGFPPPPPHSNNKEEVLEEMKMNGKVASMEQLFFARQG